MENKESKTLKVCITSPNTYIIKHENGIEELRTVEPTDFPSEEPEGYVWNFVLEQFIPEVLADAEIIVDASTLPHWEENEGDGTPQGEDTPGEEDES